MKSFKAEIFKRQFSEKVVKVRASLEFQKDEIDFLEKKGEKDEVIKRKLSRMIANEIEKYLEPDAVDIPRNDSKSYHSEVYFMSRDTMRWLLTEIEYLLIEKRKL